MCITGSPQKILFQLHQHPHRRLSLHKQVNFRSFINSKDKLINLLIQSDATLCPASPKLPLISNAVYSYQQL